MQGNGASPLNKSHAWLALVDQYINQKHTFLRRYSSISTACLWLSCQLWPELCLNVSHASSEITVEKLAGRRPNHDSTFYGHMFPFRQKYYFSSLSEWVAEIPFRLWSYVTWGWLQILRKLLTLVYLCNFYSRWLHGLGEINWACQLCNIFSM